MKKQVASRHMWTKDEIKKIIHVWEDTDVATLAKDLKVTPMQVQYMVNLIRKKGYKLTKKRKTGYVSLLIEEAISELKNK